MPVSQNIGTETVCATIKRMEHNNQSTQALPKINDLPAMRGGDGGGDFTNARIRRGSAPSNPTTKG